MITSRTAKVKHNEFNNNIKNNIKNIKNNIKKQQLRLQT